VSALYSMGLHYTEPQPSQIRDEIARILLRSFSTALPANVSKPSSKGKKRGREGEAKSNPPVPRLDLHWAELRRQSNHTDECCDRECAHWAVHVSMCFQFAEPVNLDPDVATGLDTVLPFHKNLLVEKRVREEE
jgi:hypothetical protein